MPLTQTVKGGERPMAAKRPQIAGQVDPALLREIEQLPWSKAKVVEWCLKMGVPHIKQAFKAAHGGIVILPAHLSKTRKP